MQGLDSLLDLSFYYTLHNGYCVKWKCETTPASTTPWRCTGTYQKVDYEYEWKIDRGFIACVSRVDYGDGSHNLVEDDADCCRDDVVETEGSPRRQCGRNPRWGMKDPTSSDWWSTDCEGTEPMNISCRYECTDNPETYPGECERKTRQIPQSCSSLNQTECGSKSWCTRTPWTTIPAGTKTACIDEQWHTRPDADCANAGAKPNCTEWKCEMRNQVVGYQCNGTYREGGLGGLLWWFFGRRSCWRFTREIDCKDPSLRSSSCSWDPIMANKNTAICRDLWGNELPDSNCLSPKPSCATPVNGQCKTHPWTHASQPATSTANGCIAGDYLDDADTNTYWQWKCKGKDWGSESICKATRWVDWDCWDNIFSCKIWSSIDHRQREMTPWSHCEIDITQYYGDIEYTWTCQWVGGGYSPSCSIVEQPNGAASQC